MRYLVVLEQGPISFGAWVPDLPGCIAAADSRDTVLALIRDAIELHVDELRRQGLSVPPPASTSEVIEVPAA